MNFPIIYRDGSRQGFIEIDLAALVAEPSKGCLMAMIEGELADKVRNFGRNGIKDENLAEDGRESKIHATVLYGFDPSFEVQPLKALLENQESISCSLGAVSRFEHPDYDVLKIEVKSPELQTLHYGLKYALSDSKNMQFKYQIYHPHLTLGYIRKGAHPELDSHQAFVKDKFSIGSLVYRVPGKSEQVFNLKNKTK